MAQNSKIEWTDHTFNLWWGCVEQGAECDHCYARTLAHRFGHPVWGKDAPRRFFGLDQVDKLLQWNESAQKARKRKLVFVQSMGDFCEIGRIEFDAARDRFFEMAERCEWLDFLLLTTLPQNFRRVLPPTWWVYPRDNVIGMVTCGHSSSLWRIETLLDTPFQRRGVSMEPLLEKIVPSNIGRLDWVIVGGESGPQARPMRAQWVRLLRDACAEYDVPFFFKQWGEWLGEGQDGAPADGLKIEEQVLNASDEPIRVGRKKAGNLLDGKVHQELYRSVALATD